MANFFKDKEKPLIDKIYYAIGYPFRKLFGAIKKGFLKIRERHFEKRPEAETEYRIKQRKFMAKMRLTRRRIFEIDKQIAARVIHTINMIDHRNDSFAEKAAKAASTGGEKFNLAREWADLNKKKLLMHFGFIILCLLIIVSAVNVSTAYEYAYNGHTLGVVKDQEDVLRIADLISSKLSEEHDADIDIDRKEDITFKRVFAIGKEIDDMEVVLNRMTYMKDMLVHGYGIYIDDKLVAVVDDKKKAQSILDSVLAAFAIETENTKYEEINFAEEVKIKKVDTKLGLLQKKNEVVKKLMTGSETIKKHKVMPGETFLGIAQEYGISTEELKKANPLVSPEKLTVGQDIVLSKPSPMLTVQTVQISTYSEPIPFQTDYIDNPSVYQGEKAVKVKGEDGERQVIAKIAKNNGEEVAKLVIESTTIKEPVKQVVSVGTKALPPKQGTGSFIYPVTGARLTSGFGRRWGSFHRGIDLACPTGTKIRAADGGTVKFSGYSGSYGYVVKIDHGGGYLTVYAHCSRLAVRAGERVYQGQYIANVGSTGRSTGPHVHFEVQYFGVPQNPLNYL